MPASNVIMEVTAKTNTGMVREGNEDNFIVTQDYSEKEWILPKAEFSNPATGAVMVVADGMGGLNAGEVASQIVVDSIREYFIESVCDRANNKAVRQVLTEAILHAHERIVAYGKKNPETAGMGSTVVVAWIVENILHTGWVGDSRCYIWRNESLVQLSKDHSYVQTLVDKGEITMEQAFLHPEGNIVTQSLGDADHSPKPGYAAFSLSDNDVVLLCSDGLNGMLQDKEIDKIITLNTGDLTATADMLIKEANAAGGNDNITVVMSKVISGAVPGPLPAGVAENGGEEALSGGRRKKKRSRALLYAGLVAAVLALAGFLIIPQLTGNGKGNEVPPVKRATSPSAAVVPPPIQTKDSDGDGVVDEKDSCKSTPKGTKVDGRGCPLHTPPIETEKTRDVRSDERRAAREDGRTAQNLKQDSNRRLSRRIISPGRIDSAINNLNKEKPANVTPIIDTSKN